MSDNKLFELIINNSILDNIDAKLLAGVIESSEWLKGVKDNSYWAGMSYGQSYSSYTNYSEDWMIID